jgi:hypothetical protein
LAGISVFFILFAASAELHKRYHLPVFSAITIIAFIGFGACCIVLGFAFRCPQCRKFVISPGTSILSFPNFYQNCGLDLRLVDKDGKTISPIDEANGGKRCDLPFKMTSTLSL